ncbi:MAG: prohead protease [Clostridium sp.]|uniref:prohead protease n=1 Tax=Clostridium sp. TaxID=1506 RepID=UPI003F2EA97F
MIGINIKQHLLKTLRNEEILNLTGDKTVHFIHANNPEIPYVEYMVFDESSGYNAEGNELVTNYKIQVDIFSKGDYTELEETIKKVMNENNYIRTNAVDLFEKETGLYHKAMRFNISLPINM